MDSPFIFSKEVTGDAFVGRKEELAWLASNIANAQNTVLIAPDKWGKTSLINLAIIQAQKQNFDLKICNINLFNVRDEQDFYTVFAENLIKTISATTGDWEQNVKQYLPQSAPNVLVSERKHNSMKLEFTDQSIASYRDEILNLPARIVEFVGGKLMICFEEFQHLADMEALPDTLKKVREAWESQPNVGYLISGGKKHLMQDLLEDPKGIFYKFGDILYLQVIDDRLLIDYMVKAFSKSGRVINKEFSEKICSYVKCHPFYVQQLAHLVWLNTKGFVNDIAYETACEELLNHNERFFQKEVDGLTNPQISFLKAIIDGVDRFTSAEVLTSYKLNSSANVARVRGALEKKEVLEFIKNKPHFIDPVFEIWFTKRFMR
ncbi:MAG: hypothetical protein LBG19_00290 [Prevotellaceae bacterium]|jgi:hypothetical protein|nr:hypothetical protein [Prevotellaceae bacterium]